MSSKTFVASVLNCWKGFILPNKHYTSPIFSLQKISIFQSCHVRRNKSCIVALRIASYFRAIFSIIDLITRGKILSRIGKLSSLFVLFFFYKKVFAAHGLWSLVCFLV